MTDTEILEKALQKAYDNGYPYPSGMGISPLELLQLRMFAKALWGKVQICDSCQFEEGRGAFSKHDPYCSERTEYSPAYQYHLQQMVIADDPIAYLKEHLDD